MNISILSNKVPWFGKYSGYECLPNYFPQNITTKVYTPFPTFFNKLIGKIYQLKNKWTFKRPEEVLSQIQFLQGLAKSEVAHILYLDGNINIVNHIGLNSNRVTGTIHIPFARWGSRNLPLLSRMEQVIILYEEDIKEFSQYIPKQRIHFIRHGVDIDFFKPNEELVKRNKVLFVGHYLRNFEMFLKVYRQIMLESSKGLEFHFIIPFDFHKSFKELVELTSEENVFFHEKLSDEELLEQYQSSYVLLMPMNESGANTAIVQAIATGLPIITTDVGGIRSYGGGDIYPIIANNDCTGMAELFKKYYNDLDYRHEISKKQRQFSEEKLDWNIIANQHVQLYKSLYKGEKKKKSFTNLSTSIN